MKQGTESNSDRTQEIQKNINPDYKPGRRGFIKGVGGFTLGGSILNPLEGSGILGKEVTEPTCTVLDENIPEGVLEAIMSDLDRFLLDSKRNSIYKAFDSIRIQKEGIEVGTSRSDLRTAVYQPYENRMGDICLSWERWLNDKGAEIGTIQHEIGHSIDICVNKYLASKLSPITLGKLTKKYIQIMIAYKSHGEKICIGNPLVEGYRGERDNPGNATVLGDMAEIFSWLFAKSVKPDSTQAYVYFLGDMTDYSTFPDVKRPFAEYCEIIFDALRSVK